MAEWSGPLKIRPARVEDAKEIARIYNQGVQDRCATFENTYVTPEERYLWLAARPDKFPVLLAEVKHTLMGWSSLNPYSPRHCYDGIAELAIYIERSLRGHGVAQELMKAMQDIARDKGFLQAHRAHPGRQPAGAETLPGDRLEGSWDPREARQAGQRVARPCAGGVPDSRELEVTQGTLNPPSCSSEKAIGDGCGWQRAIIIALIFYNLSRSPEWANFRWARLWALITGAKPGLLLLALVGVFGTYFVRALRWRFFLSPIKKASLWVLLKGQILGFSSIYLIGRPGEFVRPAYIAKKENVSMSAMLAVWLLERIFDTVFLLLLFAAALNFRDG